LQAGKGLAEQRAIDRNALLEWKRKRVQERRSLWQRIADLALRRQTRAALTLQIVNLRNDLSKTAKDEMKETRQRIFAVSETIRPVLDALRRKTVVASSPLSLVTPLLLGLGLWV
jgi:acyl-CoA reductase-like NAD-dependent aldehyde dehydrogenase